VTVKVKICGVTTVADAQACSKAGADAIGLNFWSRSKRFVEIARASAIARALPSGVLKIGVFVDAPRHEIERAIDALGLDAIQLHGHETPQACCGFTVQVIKAISMRPGSEPAALLANYQAKSPHLKVEYLDPSRQPARVEEIIKTFGLGRGDRTAIVFSSGERHRHITLDELVDVDMSAAEMGMDELERSHQRGENHEWTG